MAFMGADSSVNVTNANADFFPASVQCQLCSRTVIEQLTLVHNPDVLNLTILLENIPQAVLIPRDRPVGLKPAHEDCLRIKFLFAFLEVAGVESIVVKDFDPTSLYVSITSVTQAHHRWVDRRARHCGGRCLGQGGTRKFRSRRYLQRLSIRHGLNVQRAYNIYRV